MRARTWVTIGSLAAMVLNVALWFTLEPPALPTDWTCMSLEWRTTAGAASCPDHRHTLEVSPAGPYQVLVRCICPTNHETKDAL